MIAGSECMSDLRTDLAKKIESFPESGMLFWRVTVVLNDGSEIKDVLCE